MPPSTPTGRASGCRARQRPGRHLGSRQDAGGRAQQAAADAGISGASSKRTCATRPTAGRAPIRPTGASRPAMPRMMIAVQPMEIVITPDTTYVMLELFNTLRRIYTDGRDWPKDVRAVLRRLFDRQVGGHRRRRPLRHAGGRDPRRSRARTATTAAASRSTQDGEAIVSERICPDKTNPNVLLQRDHHHRPRADAALDREAQLPPRARQAADLVRVCLPARTTTTFRSATENYIISGDGYLMPVRKGQPAPDLKYFQ